MTKQKKNALIDRKPKWGVRKTEAAKTQEKVSAQLLKAYEHLKANQLDEAMASLDGALKLDFEHPEVLYALKCGAFWQERVGRANQIHILFERGDFFLSQWKQFCQFQTRLGGVFDECSYAFRHFVFSSALNSYSTFEKDTAGTEEAELNLRIGRCHKGIGNYEQAIVALECAAKTRKDDAEILCELADVYSLVNETRMAKALFREAFFLNPAKIDLESIESLMIVRLIAKLKEGGLEAPQLQEWLPVYAVLLGIFTVKRELKAIELGKLKQSIYQLENEVKENALKKQVILPRLLNRYFWLIDHYIATNEDKSKTDEILLKIKLLDATVYKQYSA